MAGSASVPLFAAGILGCAGRVKTQHPIAQGRSKRFLTETLATVDKSDESTRVVSRTTPPVKEETFSNHSGWLAGETLLFQTMTVNEAIKHAVSLKGCAGFYYQGGPCCTEAVDITFKSEWVLEASSWFTYTAYKVESASPESSETVQLGHAHEVLLHTPTAEIVENALGPVTACKDECENVGRNDSHAPVASFQNEVCSMSFHQSCGFGSYGLLELKSRHGRIDISNAQHVMATLAEWCETGILRKHFVAVFDISHMEVPSIMRMYYLLQMFKEHMPSIKDFRTYQQHFAVIRGESLVFNTLVDTLISASGATSVPVFGADKDACLVALQQRMQDSEIPTVNITERRLEA